MCRLLYSGSLLLAVLSPVALDAQGGALRGGGRPAQDTSRKSADTLSRTERRAISEAVRDARTINRRRLSGDSATRAQRTAEAASTAFGSPEARAVLDRARQAREQQDSALRSYRATTTQRMSVHVGARRVGLEKLLFRGENVAEVAWRREVGVRVRPMGSRMTVPTANSVAGDFVSAVSIPYFPGKEQLWFPSSDFGKVKTEVDDREIIHPLARGAERWYRYETGDSARITLPDGRAIQLRELRITARKPDWRTFVGSFWFDRDGGQLVRAAYRLATEIDIWGVASEEAEQDLLEQATLNPVRDSILRARLPREAYAKDSTRRARSGRGQGQNGDDAPPLWLTATMRPMRAKLDAITVEYALYQGKFWLPRAHSATASADVMFMRIPFRLDEKFSYEDVDGDFTLPPLPPMLESIAVGDASKADAAKVDSAAVDRGASNVSIALGVGTPDDRERARRDSVQNARYGSGRQRQCRNGTTWTRLEERYERSVRIAYDLPCDMSTLVTSPALPPETATDEELFDLRSADQLAEALGMSLQVPFLPQRPTIRTGSDLFRYNRVEGLSVGVEVKQRLGAGYTLRGVGRIGHADRHGNGELSLSRTTGPRTVTASLYHRLNAVNPEWGGALTLGPSLPALIYGRDEGFYFRAYGFELGEQHEQRRGALEYRLFVERQWTAGDSNAINTFSLARVVSGGRFRENLLSEPGAFTGVQGSVSRVLVERPRGLRFTGIARAEAATGTFTYARGSVEATASRPYGRLSAAVTGSVGSSQGRVPFQRGFAIGGVRTVRGQLPGTQQGDAFWFSRAEVGTRSGAVRPVAFFDVGWAGSRKTFGQIQPQRGTGLGLGFLDGLFRIDVARGLYPFRGWRTDLYLEAPI